MSSLPLALVVLLSSPFLCLPFIRSPTTPAPPAPPHLSHPSALEGPPPHNQRSQGHKGHEPADAPAVVLVAAAVVLGAGSGYCEWRRSGGGRGGDAALLAALAQAQTLVAVRQALRVAGRPAAEAACCSGGFGGARRIFIYIICGVVVDIAGDDVVLIVVTAESGESGEGAERGEGGEGRGGGGGGEGVFLSLDAGRTCAGRGRLLHWQRLLLGVLPIWLETGLRDMRSGGDDGSGSLQALVGADPGALEIHIPWFRESTTSLAYDEGAAGFFEDRASFPDAFGNATRLAEPMSGVLVSETSAAPALLFSEALSRQGLEAGVAVQSASLGDGVGVKVRNRVARPVRPVVVEDCSGPAFVVGVSLLSLVVLVLFLLEELRSQLGSGFGHLIHADKEMCSATSLSEVEEVDVLEIRCDFIAELHGHVEDFGSCLSLHGDGLC